MKHFLPLFLLFLFPALLHSQTPEPLDTVYLMSGRTLAGVVKDTSAQELKVLVPSKNGEFKADYVDIDLVFSVKYRNGKEEVFYQQDTLFGNYYTPQEVRFFLQGERDALRSFRCPWVTAGAFVAGFAGGYTQNFFLTFVPPFAYAGSTTFFRIKIRPGTVSSPDYLKYDTYLLGYEKEARKRRVFRSLMFGGIGMVAGFATSSLIN
jgi:hypothetical protein